MILPLVDSSDLDGFPGAPFDPLRIAEASASIRAEAGWHIAPEVSETLTLDHSGGRLLCIPTLRLRGVDEVRDVRDPDNVSVLDNWTVSRTGLLYRADGWPSGFGAIEIDLTHGYDYCPGELIPVVAARCQAAAVLSTVKQESSGSESVTYMGGPGTDRRVHRYRIPVLG